MIDKIIKLRGVGLLHDATINGAIQLKKITAIYAENGQGKSTFASILRSLVESNVELLLARKTIRGTYEPTIEIQINGRIYKFENGNWLDTYHKILVFDSEFVDKNVYSGNRLEPQHRENLLEFVLGEQGVSLKREIDEITHQINDINRQLRETSRVIETYAKPYSVEDFINLRPDEELSQKLIEAQKKLSDAENAEAIKKRPEQKTIQLPIVRTEEIERLLAESIDTIAADAERKVREHIQRHLDEHGERWIRKGLRYIQSDKCPFCLQSLQGVEIIGAYRDYFDKSYETLKQRIEEAKEGILAIFADKNLDEINNVVTNNNAIQVSWNDQKDIVFPIPPEQSEIAAVWRELRDSYMDILQRKADSPLSRIEITETVHNAIDRYHLLHRKLDAYNQAVIHANEAIRKIKNTVSAINIADIKEMIAKLKAQEKRWEGEVNNICKEYSELKARKERLEDKKVSKREKLEQYTNEILDNYEGAINRILRTFGAGFSIEKITTEHVRGTPRTTYRLRILGESVPILQSRSTIQQSFGNVLSDGDKRTLALAFFLARLETDPHLSERIVIIDDPVSSFDMQRKRATRDVLICLGKKCSQLIVLSHDAYFIRDIERNASDYVLVLQIRRRGDYSIFDSCDIHSICQSEYYNNYKTLVRYLEEGTSSDRRKIAKSIRPYLEASLYNRFPIELEGANNLGRMIRKIRESTEGNCLYRMKSRLDELERINDFASPFMHADNSEPSVAPLTDAELRPMVELALDIGRG